MCAAPPARATESQQPQPGPESPAGEATSESSGLDARFLLESLGPPLGVPLAGESLEHRAHEVSSLVRCPVCQGASVADSPSTMAQNMKAEVRDLLARGYDQEQIIRYFELSYGEFVRLQPKADGFNLLLWAMPLLVLVGGLGAAAFAMRRMRRAKAETSAPAARDPLPDDPELARYVLRVRELAYGWPGGVRPSREGETHG